MPISIRYSFSQHFDFSAEAAYAWCTDYQPDDHALTGNPEAKRAVTWIADGTVLLKEIIPASSGAIEKEKLVQLYPERQMWISTHMSGPNKYSQFTYQLVEEGQNGSRLDFSALHIEHKENLTEKDKEALAKELCRCDAEMWRRYAAAMARGLSR